MMPSLIAYSITKSILSLLQFGDFWERPPSLCVRMNGTRLDVFSHEATAYVFYWATANCGVLQLSDLINSSANAWFQYVNSASANPINNYDG